MRHSLPLARAGLVVGVVGLIFATRAMPAEYCVTCAGPDATYRCEIAGLPEGRPQTAAQIRCISDIAKAGAHKNCSISRTHSDPCNGPLHTITLERPPEAPLQDPRTAQPREEITTPPGTMLSPTFVPPPPPDDNSQRAAAPSPEADAPQQDEQGNPIGNAARAAGQSIDKAGQAVGTAARKSWDCVTSLFRGC